MLWPYSISQIQPPFLLAQHCAFVCFLLPLKHNFCPCMFGCLASHWNSVSLARGNSLRENGLSPSRYHFLQPGHFVPTSPFVWNMVWLEFTGGVDAVTVTVSSHVWLPCCVQMMLFPYSRLPSFSSSFCHLSSSFYRLFPVI